MHTAMNSSLLVQLLTCVELRDELLGHLPKLERSLNLALKTSYDLDPEHPATRAGMGFGASPQVKGPESVVHCIRIPFRSRS